MLYTHKIPSIIKWLKPGFVWSMPDSNKVYLTFDDGPIPDITPFVLDTLSAFNAKATFFCLGKNVAANPSIFNRIISEGHSIGNHTVNHPNGLKTDAESYFKEVLDCEQILSNHQKTGPLLFRPPYGRLRSSQSKQIKAAGYSIILWDVLSGDFDQQLSPEQCLKNTIKSIRPGSIVVFHDSVKAWPRLQMALPAVCKYIQESGWQFGQL